MPDLARDIETHLRRSAEIKTAAATECRDAAVAAAEAIAKIKKSKEAGEYDYTTDNLVNFHKKFVLSY